MPATPLDSALYRDLLGDPEIAQLFTDSAEVRAMLLVLGSLARAQATHGLIPETAAAAIHRASLEVQIDPTALAAETGTNAVPVPALVTAFRAGMNAPEHAQYVHWGATSQDIMETALMLRLSRIRAVFETRLAESLATLATLAETHADLPMAARTYGQAAVPTSFGAVTANWGRPLLAQHAALSALTLPVSLSGAAGTLSAMGENGPAIRASLAETLDLADPGHSWHSDRTPVIGLAATLTALNGALGKMGEDLILLTQTGIDEVTLGATGASSTMPQKTNPVAPSILAALARTAVALNTAVQGAALHRRERDGAAWITEWLTLPQLVMLTGRALATAADLVSRIAPNPDAMARNLSFNHGLIHAEALTFALAATMPRPEAQAESKRLCTNARETGRSLADVALAAHPDLSHDTFDPSRGLGQAPEEARAFATTVRDGG